jgi:hypothetical protein
VHTLVIEVDRELKLGVLTRHNGSGQASLDHWKTLAGKDREAERGCRRRIQGQLQCQVDSKYQSKDKERIRSKREVDGTVQRHLEAALLPGTRIHTQCEAAPPRSGHTGRNPVAEEVMTAVVDWR